MLSYIESIILTSAKQDSNRKTKLTGPDRSPFHAAAEDLENKGFGKIVERKTEVTVFEINDDGIAAVEPVN